MKRPGGSRGLATWLATVLTVVMVPLAVLAMFLAWSLALEADNLARQALLARTETAAAPLRRVLQQALGAADGLGAAIMVDQADTDRCNDILREYEAATPGVAFAGFVTSAGVMTCSSTGEMRDFSQTEDLQEQMRIQEPVFLVSRRGRITQRSIVGAIMPVFRHGDLQGFVFLSLPNDTAAEGWQHPGGGDVDVLTLTIQGDIVSATGDLDAAGALLPDGLTSRNVVDRVGQAFAAPSAQGQERYYAVSALIPGKVVVMGSYPVAEAKGVRTEWSRLAPVALPVLIWGAGVLGGLLALRWLVLRHLTELVSAMGRFASGDRKSPPLVLRAPPREFAAAEAAFLDMARHLTDAERRAERDLSDKSILLREVHHRVKNNLQLIASITHLQGRNVDHDETRAILRGLERRVRGLAGVHVALSSGDAETRVNARALLRDVVAESESDLHISLDELWLYPDQAVPFSMFTTEALEPNAVDGAGAARAISLSHVDEVAHLEIRFEGGATTGAPGSRLSARLLEAFAQQLDATLTMSETPEGIALLLTFVPRTHLALKEPVTVS